MEIKQVTIELNEETMRRLEEKAMKAGKKIESFAADLVETGLGKDLASTEKKMPGVAMLKGNVDNVLPVSEKYSAGIGLIKQTPEAITGPAFPDLPPERLRRKAEIEDKMRDLSLVIDTAEEADKEKYAMQYAILAAELDALI